MRVLTQGSILATLLIAAAPSPPAAPPAIRHEPPACFLAESYPRITASIAPADGVAKARVYFRPESAPAMPVTATTPAKGPSSSSSRSNPGSGALADSDPLDGGGRSIGATAWQWYAVTMSREGDTFTAVLPRPRMTAQKVRYFIEATGTTASSVQGAENVVEVVGAESACGGRRVGEALASAQVVVEVPPGAPLVPPVPQGFSPVGASAVEGSVVARKSRHKGLWLGLGGAALGGAVAASQLSAGDSATGQVAGPLHPGFALVTTFPQSGGIVSVSRPFVELRIRVVPFELMRNANVTARLYSSSEPSRTCGVMRQSVFELRPDYAQQVRLFILEDPEPCGAVDRVHVELFDAEGRQVLSTGSSQPDLVISLNFSP